MGQKEHRQFGVLWLGETSSDQAPLMTDQSGSETEAQSGTVSTGEICKRQCHMALL